MIEMAYAFNEDKSKFDLDTIAGNIATIETSPVVSNHSKGEYILYENVLYEVISPIASGESLVLGTNVRSISIGDQLKDLQDSVSKLNGWNMYSSLRQLGLSEGCNINQVVAAMPPQSIYITYINDAITGLPLTQTFVEVIKPNTNAGGYVRCTSIWGGDGGFYLGYLEATNTVKQWRRFQGTAVT